MAIDYSNTLKYHKGYFTQSEVDSILEYCFKNEMYREYVLFRLLYHSARRITEIVGIKPYTRYSGLRPMDIDFKENMVTYVILKKDPVKINIKKITRDNIKKAFLKRDINLDTKMIDKLYALKSEPDKLRIKAGQLANALKKPRTRTLPLPAKTVKILAWYIKKNDIADDERIFNISRQWADIKIKLVCDKLNITRDRCKPHCHMFRHGFAIKLLKDHPKNQRVLLYVKNMLQHHSLQMTEVYLQFADDENKEILEQSFG